MKRGKQADGEMQPRAGVSNLRTGHKRRAVRNAGRAHGPAHRLSDVLVSLEIGVGTGRAEALDRSHHYLRIELVDFLPRKTQPVQHARAEVLHYDVALLQQVHEYRLALGTFHIDGNRALVAIEHREIKTVGIGHVAQLAARRVALRRLEFNHVCAHPCEQLRARRPGLHMCHVEDAHAL